MASRFQKLKIPGLVYVESDIFGDDRGFFAEIYKASLFKTNGIKTPFVQVNHSKSARGVLRGLHYQNPPRAQGKLVSVVAGEVFDVAVDIRKGSSSYGQWHGVNLSAAKKNMLYIPEGFAHGFCTISPTAEVIYYCTDEYSPEHEGGVIYNDPALGIDWPVKDPVLSSKDQKFPVLNKAVNHFKYEK